MWKELLPYEGRDLRELDGAGIDRLLNSLNQLFPEYVEASSLASPSYLWRIKDRKHILRYIIVDGEQLQRVPGTSKACICLFDEGGKLLGATEFSTGWRIDIKDMALIEESIIRVPVVVILSCPLINGRDIAKQYYALSNGHAVLVRLEDSNGTITPNRYTPSNLVVGPIVRKRSVVEWEATLDLTDEVEILRALMWIGGIHHDSVGLGSCGPRPYQGSSEYVPEVHQLRRRELLQERLSRLRDSDNQWIREAAELAANSSI